MSFCRLFLFWVTVRNSASVPLFQGKDAEQFMQLVSIIACMQGTTESSLKDTFWISKMPGFIIHF